MPAKIKLIKDFPLISPHKQRPFIADARYCEDGLNKPVVVFVHGFKGFKDWGHFNLIADHFAQEGFVFIKLNLSHNGTTPESPLDFADLKAFSENNFSIELDDIGALIDTLPGTDGPVPEKEMDAERVYIIGHSRGGSLALLKAYEDKRIKKVAAWAPVHDLSERWPEEVLKKWKEEGIYYVYNGRTKQNMPMKYQIVEDFQSNRDRLDVPKAVKNLNIPVLLIHGTTDETLPYQNTERLAGPGSDIIFMKVQGANHVFGGSHPFTGRTLPDHTLKIVNKTVSFFQSE